MIKNILNWASLLTSGIGEDYIYLNEFMAKNTSLLDFVTLFDYDFADHEFQEKARHSEDKDYQRHDYYAYRHPSWVRLLIDGLFYYATFTSLATHITDELDVVGNDTIGELIPHKYVAAKDNGKPVSNEGQKGFVWDMQLDAAGQESQLEELKSRWYIYVQERWLALSKTNADNNPRVYLHENFFDRDPHQIFIFNNEDSLKKIRWKHFLSDCKPLMAGYDEVKKLLEQEAIDAKDFLTKNYNDILNNFNADVIRFRRKTKIVIAPKAFEDLNKIDPEDENPA